MPEIPQQNELGLRSGEFIGMQDMGNELALEATIRDDNIIIEGEHKAVYVKHGFRLSWLEARRLRDMLTQEIARHEAKPCSFSG